MIKINVYISLSFFIFIYIILQLFHGPNFLHASSSLIQKTCVLPYSGIKPSTFSEGENNSHPEVPEEEKTKGSQTARS